MNKRLVRIFVPILLVASFYVGDVEVVRAQKLPPPPPPARDYNPKTWEEFSSQDGKFRIRFPNKPIESVNKQERFAIHVMEYKGLLDYQVSYVDYKVSVDDSQKVKASLQSVKSAALDAIRDREFRIVAEREVVIDGYHGVFVHVEVQGKEVVRMQWVAAGTILYSISAASRKGTPNELEGKDDFQKVAMGFIDSFHVLP